MLSALRADSRILVVGCSTGRLTWFSDSGDVEADATELADPLAVAHGG